ncbi:TetR/AcrR family transcriptional regulator [Nocardia sp. CA-084685]|uniref:TetR/AcrR family transcriptional regulator n=1 Tax=Nocardia sp. CA-084685 TaxID=3239970 RepID=UPI003D97E7A4
MTEAISAAIAEHAESDPLAVLRHMITGVVDGLTRDPRRAQILFGDHAGSAVLERRRHELTLVSTDKITGGMQPYLRADVNRAELRHTALMAVGGFGELVIAWRAGLVDLDPEAIIEQAVHFGSTLGANFLPPE